MAINASFGSPSEMAAWEGLRDYGRPRGQYSDLAKQAELVGMDYESYAAMSPEEQQRLLDEALGDPYELAGIEVTGDRAETPEFVYDYLNKSTTSEFPTAPGDPSIGGGSNMIGETDPDRYPELDPFTIDQSTLTGAEDIFQISDEEFQNLENEDFSDLEDDDTIDYEPKPGGRIYGQRGPFNMPRGPGMVRLGPNVSFPVGPFLAGGAAVTLTGDDDEETTVPAILPGDDDMDDTTTTTTPTYTLDPMGRIIPSAMATGDTPGTLKELQDFFNMYGGPGGGMGGEFAQRMADVTGAGQTAYAQQVLGMEGDAISAFDIAREASSQQRGALGDVFGLGPDATYADITAAGTAPMQALSQVRETVLPGLQSAFQTAQERLDKGLTGRERQQVEQATRARFGALGRGADTAALATEIGDIMQEERGLYSQNLQDLLGIGGTTGALIGQEAYAMSPFTQAAIGSADLGPGLALAGDIGRQAAAATPSPTDIFGLEAGERQFALDEQALQEAGKAGRFDVLASILSAGASGFRGGPYAGLQQQTLGTPPYFPYFPQQSQENNLFRYF
jgi:hypothetical protein